MTHEKILEYCLTKKGAYEDCPFGDGTVCVKVKKRIFAQLFYLKGDFYRNLYPNAVTRGYHCPSVQQPYFNTVRLDGDVPGEEILRMIDGSYRYVVGKLAKKVQRELENE